MARPNRPHILLFGLLLILGYLLPASASASNCDRPWAYSFGRNFHSQLGNNGTIKQTTPVAVTTSGVLDGLDITAVAAGGSFSLVLSGDDLFLNDPEGVATSSFCFIIRYLEST